MRGGGLIPPRRSGQRGLYIIRVGGGYLIGWTLYNGYLIAREIKDGFGLCDAEIVCTIQSYRARRICKGLHTWFKKKREGCFLKLTGEDLIWIRETFGGAWYGC